MDNYIFDGRFSGNILIVGRIFCGKTTFIQKLAINDCLGDLRKAEWLSHLKLGKTREVQIQPCFKCPTDFHYPKNLVEFEDLIEEFKVRSEVSESTIVDNDNEFSDSFYGENKERDQLVVMDDVSGLADRSEKFSSFLTVARKCRCHCVDMFHIIHHEKVIWRSIISQTNIFNTFPASVPFNLVRKLLEIYCIGKSAKYIPQKLIWLNRLFIDLANSGEEKVYLTIDCSGQNSNDPSKFRLNADKPNFRICYFNMASDEQVYDTFLSRHIRDNEFKNLVQFKIEKIKSKTCGDIFMGNLN